MGATRLHIDVPWALQSQEVHQTGSAPVEPSQPDKRAKNKFKRGLSGSAHAPDEPPTPAAAAAPKGPAAQAAMPGPALAAGVPLGQKTKVKRKQVLDEKKRLKKLKKQVHIWRSLVPGCCAFEPWSPDASRTAPESTCSCCYCSRCTRCAFIVPLVTVIHVCTAAAAGLARPTCVGREPLSKDLLCSVAGGSGGRDAPAHQSAEAEAGRRVW